MKLPIIPFLSKNNVGGDAPTGLVSPSLWPWPHYCHRPRTLSFRTADAAGHVFKMSNSAYSVDGSDTIELPAEDVNINVHQPEDDGHGEEEEDDYDLSVVEMAVQGLRSSERLFFEPGETSSILEETKRVDGELPEMIRESLVMSVESRDPYVDFRKSMEEMVRAYGVRDWDGLKGLLDWYLRVNGKASHGHILAAFVDLLVNVQSDHHRRRHESCPSSPPSPSSPLSLYTSSASSSSSSNSLSTPSISVLEPDDRTGSSSSSNIVPRSSFGVAEDSKNR